MPVSLKNFMSISMMRGRSLLSSLIRRLCVHILLQRVPRKKNGGQVNEALGRSRGGFTTKRHAAVSVDFLPLRFTLTAGQRHDMTQASALIADYKSAYVIADASYDSNAFRAEIAAGGSEAVIRPRKSRVEDIPCDKVVYKLRNVIERFFSSVEAVSSGCDTV